MHRSPPCPEDEYLWSVAAARLVLPADDPPAGAAQPVRRLRPPARRRHRRLGRRLPGDARPRQPRAAVARDRPPARRHRGPGLRAWPPAHDLPRVRPRPGALARPRHALPRARPQPTPRAWAASRATLGTRAPTSSRPRSSPPRAGPVARVGEVLAGVLMGQEVDVDEIVTLFSARGPEVAAVAEVADELRARMVGDVVTWVANRNINYTNVCTFKCKFCAFSKGPLSLNLRGTPYLLEVDEITAGWPRPRRWAPPRCACRAASIPTSTATTTSTSSRPCARRRARHPHPRLHRPRGHRGGQAPRRAAGRLPAPADGRRAQDAAGHGGRDPRRRDPRRAVPRQGQHRGVARGPPHRPLRRAALEHHDHVRLDRAARALGPPHRAHPRPAEGDRRLHRVRAAAVRAHGGADLPAAQEPPGPDVPRGAAHARRGPHRLPRLGPQHPGVVGEDGRRRRPPGAAGRGQRPRRHA